MLATVSCQRAVTSQSTRPSNHILTSSLCRMAQTWVEGWRSITSVSTVRSHNILQGRVDQNWNNQHQFFARYTFDDADQQLPTDFPQFPRSFRSRNQFFTAEDRFIQSSTTIHTFRLGFSRTRIGQQVEANTTQPLQPFVPGREIVGNIDIGGIPRFGPQTSVSVRLTQNVFGLNMVWSIHEGATSSKRAGSSNGTRTIW